MVPAPANATIIQDFEITAKPNVPSTKKVKRSVTLKITTGTRDTNNGPLPATAAAQIFFPRGGRWNGDLFPICDPGTIEGERSVESCPPGSMIGKGKVIGNANAGEVRQDDLTVAITNGGPKSANMFIEGARPLRIQSNVRMKITRITGKYGIRLDIKVPNSLQEPAPGVIAGIELMEITVGAKRRVGGQMRGIMEIDRCDGGRWFGEGTFTYRGGLKLSAGREVTCKNPSSSK